MDLKSFSVKGFRSLADVCNIPVSNPTILAGPNDSGKTAVGAALRFLLGDGALTEDDRTYIRQEDGAQLDKPARYDLTEVEGQFVLGEWEQEKFHLPGELTIRRSAGEDLTAHLECWLPVPLDDRLRDLSAYKVPELKDLAKELGISPIPPRRAEIEEALREYAAQHSGPPGWVGAPAELRQRLPRVLSFGGNITSPEDSIKSVLRNRFNEYIEDGQLKQQIEVLESGIKDQLRTDAESLCAHIQGHCNEFTEVIAEPEISFSQAFSGVRLKIARQSGERVGLDGSGQGSARRITLAVWEWTSQLLADEVCEPEAGDPGTEETGPQPGPIQTIVLYDEPDTHLDYLHQRKVMQLIRKQCSQPHVSVLVATHSMNLIDGVDIADVVNLTLRNGRTVMERLGTDDHQSIDDYLRQIADTLGLRNSVLLHERYFLAVEGESEQRAFPLLFKLSEGMSLQSAGIALWACYNNEGALHLARYLHNHGRSVMIAIDADSRTAGKGMFKDERLRQIFGKETNDIVKMIGEPDDVREFEELFSDDLWAEVANKEWPRNESPWTASRFEAFRGQKFSTKVQRMLQDESDQGPESKPEMMFTLACYLTDPKQVPEQLRGIFDELRRRAS